MGANTKIFVFKAKELIYTGIFFILGILFLLLLIRMFLPGQEGTDNSTNDTTVPTMNEASGVYSSSIHLGGSSVDVKVTISNGSVTSISLSNLSEATASMYPLLTTTVDSINEQLSSGRSIDAVSYDGESQYTNTLLIQAISNALSKVADK